MTLRIHTLSRLWAVAAALLIITIAAGCGGGRLTDGDDDASYTLEVVAEKDLGTQVDWLHIRFLKEGVTVVDGYVKVNSDSLSLTASGYALRSFAGSQYPHGEEIQIEAVDPDAQFVYRDSVYMPTTLGVDVVPEADTVWQPNDGAVSIQWSLADSVDGYIVSVTPRTPGNPAPGLAEETVGGSFSFSPVEVFYDPLTDTLVSDLYDVRVVAYNQTFVQRQQSPYVLPPTSAFPPTTDNNDIAARISAIVISPRAVIAAQKLNP
jgi:hypothetical protein